MATKTNTSWRNKNARKKQILEYLTPGSKVVVFDTETTGLDENAQIIQFSAIKYCVTDNYKLEELCRMDEYINPGVLISDKITEITGITNEILEEHKGTKDIFPFIKNFLTDKGVSVWIGYNIPFDIRMLHQTANIAGNYIDEIPSIDVLEMARDWVDIDSHKLSSVATYLYPDENIQFHSAIEDVKATTMVLEYLIPSYIAFEEDGHNEYVHLEKASLFVNPKQGSQQRIRILLSEGELGDIYYDIVKKKWGCKTSSAAKRLFARADIGNLEKQMLEKYGYRFGLKTIDEIARSWMSFKREKAKEKKNAN